MIWPVDSLFSLLDTRNLSPSSFLAASIFGIGAIFGGFLAGYLGSQFGRRKALLILTVPDICGWILIAASQGDQLSIKRALLAQTAQ